MKKEIIIFKDQKPTKEEICHSIEHFCMDHSIDCICVTRRDRILYKIDGELYQTKIQEDHLDHPKFSSFLYNSNIFSFFLCLLQFDRKIFKVCHPQCILNHLFTSLKKHNLFPSELIPTILFPT